MPQVTFTCNKKDLELIETIDEMASKDDRSRSGMIVLLLHQAVKEKLRRRNARQNNTTDNSADSCQSNAGR